MAIALLLAFGLGIFIFLVYKKTYNGVMYSAGFGVTLIALTMITTSGHPGRHQQCGAFPRHGRRAVHRPLPHRHQGAVGHRLPVLGHRASGIVLAAGMIPLAVIGSVWIGLVLLIFVNRKPHTNPYIAVVNCSDHAAEQRAAAYLKTQTQRMVIKGKTAQKNAIEVNFEVRLKDDNTDFINVLSEMEGVQSAVLVSYNGDYMG